MESSAELVDVSDRTLGRVFRTLHFTPAEQAVVDKAIYTAKANGGEHHVDAGSRRLADAVDRQRQHATHKWLHADEAAMRHFSRMGETFRDRRAKNEAIAVMRQQFVARMKPQAAHKLEPMEIMAARYCLFADNPELGAFQFMELLFTVPWGLRIATHNWALINFDFPRTKKEEYGDIIAKLTVPLYPHFGAELQAVNYLILETAQTKATTARSVLDDITGAGVLAVTSVDGQPVVDVGVIESAYKVHHQQLAAQALAIQQLQASMQKIEKAVAQNRCTFNHQNSHAAH